MANAPQTPKPERLSRYRQRLRNSLFGKAERVALHSAENTVRGINRSAGRYEAGGYYYSENEHAGSAGQVFRNGVLLNNPVLFNALGVALIVGAANTVSKALVLSLAVTALLVVAESLTCLLYNRLDTVWRLVAYLLTGGLLFIPLTSLLFNRWPAEVSALGIYLPLCCVSGLVSVRCELFAVSNPLPRTLADALGCSLGFAWVTLLTASLRELLGRGTFAGIPVFANAPLPAATSTFFAFILLGLIAALCQHLRLRRLNAAGQLAPTGGEAQ